MWEDAHVHVYQRVREGRDVVCGKTRTRTYISACARTVRVMQLMWRVKRWVGKARRIARMRTSICECTNAAVGTQLSMPVTSTLCHCITER